MPAGGPMARHQHANHRACLISNPSPIDVRDDEQRGRHGLGVSDWKASEKKEAGIEDVEMRRQPPKERRRAPNRLAAAGGRGLISTATSLQTVLPCCSLCLAGTARPILGQGSAVEKCGHVERHGVKEWKPWWTMAQGFTSQDPGVIQD
ncbi:uncharacterized protein CLUP02_04063 [Colletotrichum lupini]|uniref:Uncharacterized protein n=1 Tax=Colletotrichum lupini TaxID=145971 RepID=A0A9Q8SJL6_9PEZI|nr:uncharacterized protein CLUP02_04063 [Colletotrichum lupini]UQC78586.1 hypothetical protein CLUP02_04063 [Colletotrichum lupini]